MTPPFTPYISPVTYEAAGDATHRLARRELELLHQEADRAFVRGTLKAGELVVGEGLQRLVPGLDVRLATTDGRS